VRELTVVGRPNSGKTMFTLNFASYIGIKTVDVTFRTYDDLITCRHFSIEDAKKELCSSTMHKTKSLQSLILKITLGKTTVNFKLTDTCGIGEKIHQEEKIRRGMAQTIGLMRCADFIFHVIDLSYITKEYINNPSTIDREIYNYGLFRNSYAILANKVDIPFAKENLTQLSSIFPKATIIPISALLSQGLKEVKTCVARNV
jgi:GTPase Era involved in 16S rRNA processing